MLCSWHHAVSSWYSMGDQHRAHGCISQQHIYMSAAKDQFCAACNHIMWHPTPHAVSGVTKIMHDITKTLLGACIIWSQTFTPALLDHDPADMHGALCMSWSPGCITHVTGSGVAPSQRNLYPWPAGPWCPRHARSYFTRSHMVHTAHPVFLPSTVGLLLSLKSRFKAWQILFSTVPKPVRIPDSTCSFHISLPAGQSKVASKSLMAWHFTSSRNMMFVTSHAWVTPSEGSPTSRLTSGVKIIDIFFLQLTSQLCKCSKFNVMFLHGYAILASHAMTDGITSPEMNDSWSMHQMTVCSC